MKLLSYYLQILLPLSLFPVLYQMNLTGAFVISLLGYILIYRPYVDGQRLLSLGSINKQDFGKIFIPFYRTKYFFDLYFKL
jgi:hypothetical protein